MEPISLIALVIVGLLLIYIAIKISKKPTSEETSSNKENIGLMVKFHDKIAVIY